MGYPVADWSRITEAMVGHRWEQRATEEPGIVRRTGVVRGDPMFTKDVVGNALPVRIRPSSIRALGKIEARSLPKDLEWHQGRAAAANAAAERARVPERSPVDALAALVGGSLADAPPKRPEQQRLF